MAGKKICFSDTELAQMFSDYVNRMQGEERHTAAACKEVDDFDTCCQSEFPNNVRLQGLMWDKMMNAAVEYEESGFIAGFKTAAALILGQEEYLPEPTNISTPKSESRLPEAEQKPHCSNDDTHGPDKYVDTKQLAKMFGRTNFKMCRTISKTVLPYLPDDERGCVVAVREKERNQKEQVIFRLDLNGCKKFLEVCRDRQHRQLANFIVGAELLKQEMEKIWCNDCGRSIA